MKTKNKSRISLTVLFAWSTWSILAWYGRWIDEKHGLRRSSENRKKLEKEGIAWAQEVKNTSERYVNAHCIKLAWNTKPSLEKTSQTSSSNSPFALSSGLFLEHESVVTHTRMAAKRVLPKDVLPLQFFILRSQCISLYRDCLRTSYLVVDDPAARRELQRELRSRFLASDKDHWKERWTISSPSHFMLLICLSQRRREHQVPTRKGANGAQGFLQPHKGWWSALCIFTELKIANFTCRLSRRPRLLSAHHPTIMTDPFFSQTWKFWRQYHPQSNPSPEQNTHYIVNLWARLRINKPQWAHFQSQHCRETPWNADSGAQEVPVSDRIAWANLHKDRVRLTFAISSHERLPSKSCLLAKIRTEAPASFSSTRSFCNSRRQSSRRMASAESTTQINPSVCS